MPCSCLSIWAAQLVGGLIRENFPSLGYLLSLGKRAETKFRLFPTCSPEDNPRCTILVNAKGGRDVITQSLETKGAPKYRLGQYALFTGYYQ